jgi:AcrR family transcriptional regulator
MSTKSRRPNREEVRASILETARDIAAAEGWSSVTVRKVAERIGYTAPIIYEHFGSKDVMLMELLKEGYDILYKYLSKAVESEQDGEKRLRAMAVGYWDFAHECTELYQLMYGMEGALVADKDARAYAVPAVKLVGDELMRFSPDRVNKSNLGVNVAELWSMFHGLISLDLSGYLATYAPGRHVLDVMTEDMLHVLRLPPAPPTPTA